MMEYKMFGHAARFERREKGHLEKVGHLKGTGGKRALK
jgi:hypothetical protein